MLKNIFSYTLILLLLTLTCASYSYAQVNERWIINIQDKADNYARWLDKPPKNRNPSGDAVIVRKFLYACSLLRAYSTIDWCASSSLTKRWLGYASQHGFNLEVKSYKKTTYNNLVFPDKIIKQINKYGGI